MDIQIYRQIEKYKVYINPIQKNQAKVSVVRKMLEKEEAVEKEEVRKEKGEEGQEKERGEEDGEYEQIKT